MNWLNRQYRLLFIYIEEHCKDAAETEMINFSGDRSQIRKYLYKLLEQELVEISTSLNLILIKACLKKERQHFLEELT